MENSEELLREVIKASNRTTRAVRAFVRFLFIQLSAITLAVLVFQIGSLTQDSSECAFGICPPSPGWTIFAGLIWVVGVVWSSFAGWSELKMSDPTTTNAVVPNCRTCNAEMLSGEQVCQSCGNKQWKM